MAAAKKRDELPADVAAIRDDIGRFFDTLDSQGRKIGNGKQGVYAFYDYDAEPIYVGQTYEKLRGRIGRHLTNQRTDAVAMNVLDPFEVAEIEIWPLDDLIDPILQEVKAGEYGSSNEKKKAVSNARKRFLDQAEFTVFQKVLAESTLGAVLNEKDVAVTTPIKLPESFRQRIIPDEIYEHRKHPDVRIARRANTIANLARVISERSVSPGLRLTLITQARRLELLAANRLTELNIDDPAPSERASLDRRT